MTQNEIGVCPNQNNHSPYIDKEKKMHTKNSHIAHIKPIIPTHPGLKELGILSGIWRLEQFDHWKGLKPTFRAAEASRGFVKLIYSNRGHFLTNLMFLSRLRKCPLRNTLSI